MEAPSISVVVPVHNGRATIARCIESLLAQTYPAGLSEIIVVDNNSNDGTPEVVGQYPVTLLYERAIQTSYAARNRGIRYAHGEVIAFTDADCEAQPDWLREFAQCFADPAVGAALGMVEDCAPESLIEEFTARVKPFAHAEQRGLKSLITANAAVRRDCLMQLGLFDESLPTAGDVDLGWRLQMRLGLKVIDAPQARVWHKHRRRLRALIGQFRRYGFSEILLTTLYQASGGATPATEQMRRMARQYVALLRYLTAFVLHLVKLPWHHFEKRYVMWPLFLLAIECANIAGKVEGLAATRFFRQSPFSPRTKISRA